MVVIDARGADLVVDPRRRRMDDVLLGAVLVAVAMLGHEAEVEEVQGLRAFEGQLGADGLETLEPFDVVA